MSIISSRAILHVQSLLLMWLALLIAGHRPHSSGRSDLDLIDTAFGLLYNTEIYLALDVTLQHAHLSAMNTDPRDEGLAFIRPYTP